MSGDGGIGAHYPRFEIQNNDGDWWFETSHDIGQGSTEREQPPHDVSCVPLTCFFSNGGSQDVRWTSDDGYVSVSAPFVPPACDTDTNTAWLGDAATVLNAIDGKVDTTSDYARVTQSTDPAVASSVSARDCMWNDSGNLRDHRYHSLFVGRPGGTHIAKFRGPNSSRGDAAATGEYVSKSWDATSTLVPMAYVDEGICYFTYLGGDFHTLSDQAWITPLMVQSNPVRYRWYLQTAKASNNTSTNGVRAHARCYLYNQNQ